MVLVEESLWDSIFLLWVTLRNGWMEIFPLVSTFWLINEASPVVGPSRSNLLSLHAAQGLVQSLLVPGDMGNKV